jgi:hypothetical protein
MSALLLDEHFCHRCGTLSIQLEELRPGYWVCWKCAEDEAQWDANRRPPRDCDDSE